MSRQNLYTFHSASITYFPGARTGQASGRGAIEHQLSQIPGKRLVIVHYKPDHEQLLESNYNDAVLDRSKIVWARDMGPAEDANLIQTFQSRKVWLLDADAKPPRITPYL